MAHHAPEVSEWALSVVMADGLTVGMPKTGWPAWLPGRALDRSNGWILAMTGADGAS